jgi:sugar lactone lactonase YvrE
MRLFLSSSLSTAVAAALLAGCGGSTTPVAPRSDALGGSQAQTSNPVKPKLHLYVASAAAGSVSVFSPGAFAPARTISRALDRPMSLAFDTAGNLYAGNTNSVTVYRRGSAHLLRKIDLSDHGGCVVYAMAFDHDGYLYVACVSAASGPGYVAIYRPHSSKRLATITRHVNAPVDVAVNHNGMVFIANASHLATRTGWVGVYAPRTTHPQRLIEDGFSPNDVPWRIAFDSSDNLYAGNTHDVTVYAPGSGTVARTIEHGIDFPRSMAFDAGGNLYVANCTSACSRRGNVTVFAPGKSRPVQTITHGIHTPLDLVVDPSGNLYVANRNSFSVSIYLPGRTVPIEMLSADLGSPSAVAIGP